VAVRACAGGRAAGAPQILPDKRLGRAARRRTAPATGVETSGIRFLPGRMDLRSDTRAAETRGRRVRPRRSTCSGEARLIDWEAELDGARGCHLFRRNAGARRQCGRQRRFGRHRRQPARRPLSFDGITATKIVGGHGRACTDAVARALAEDGLRSSIIGNRSGADERPRGPLRREIIGLGGRVPSLPRMRSMPSRAIAKPRKH